MLILLVLLGIVLWICYQIYWRVWFKTDWRGYRGEWAVITGASDGLGRAFAEGLARRGLNVVILSRTPTKVQECVDYIKVR
jgi:NADPH:quinone reductase-like Zn-dependent oxidoreductase